MESTYPTELTSTEQTDELHSPELNDRERHHLDDRADDAGTDRDELSDARVEW